MVRTFSHLQKIGGRLISPGGASSCTKATGDAGTTNSLLLHRRPLQIQRLGPLASSSAPQRSVTADSHAVPQSRQQFQFCRGRPSPLFQPSWTVPTQCRLASKSKSRKRSNNKVGANVPLLNEHLIAALFNQKRGDAVVKATADTYEVRLVVDRGPNGLTANAEGKDNAAGDAPAAPATQVTTVAGAISIAHDLSLDLMEVTLRSDPPVIKAVDFDRWLYERKKRERRAAVQKRREGGGAISDRPLKEFKFRAGIADHDLARKAGDMVKYLARGHAIRVTLTARKYMLAADEGAIATTMDRVRELLGDRAVEARGMKANDRKTFGSLLLHPNKSSKA